MQGFFAHSMLFCFLCSTYLFVAVIQEPREKKKKEKKKKLRKHMTAGRMSSLQFVTKIFEDYIHVNL